MTTEYKYDVFISYSRKDYVDEHKNLIPGNEVSKIKEALTEAGITYWFDEEGIYSGDNFTEKIIVNIEASRIFLFLSTKNACESQWTSKEIACADEFGKYIIPVRIDKTPYSKKVMFRIADLSYVDYGKNPEKGRQEIVNSIKVFLQKIKDAEEQKKAEEMRKQKEEEERKKREEQAKKKREAIKEIKRLATDYRMHSLQQETIVQQLHEKNLIIGKETKECPICKTTNPIETTFCENCGFQFPQLYAVDGNESYPFDNQLLVTAKANYDAIAFAKKEKERLENKVAELTYSFEKISVECEQQLKTISQKEAEVVSCRKKCETLSVQLKNSKEQFEKLKSIEIQKKELENQIRKLQREKDEANQKIKELEKGREPYHDSSRWYEQSAERSSQQKEIGSPIFGALNGLFSIRPGKQVCFSKGNLQYQGGSIDNWRFADNQFDYIGKANESVSDYYSGWIDLFGWGTGFVPKKVSVNQYDYKQFNDWGKYHNKNEGNTSIKWYTLSQDEWAYLLKYRSTPSKILFAKARVNGVNGLILLPDNWHNNNYSIKNYNQEGVDFSTNTISSFEWLNILQTNGAVFLPAAGYREGTTVRLEGSYGGYWSASEQYDGYAFLIDFNNNSLYVRDITYRHFGRSVRLVCDVK